MPSCPSCRACFEYMRDYNMDEEVSVKCRHCGFACEIKFVQEAAARCAVHEKFSSTGDCLKCWSYDESHDQFAKP